MTNNMTLHDLLNWDGYDDKVYFNFTYEKNEEDDDELYSEIHLGTFRVVELNRHLSNVLNTSSAFEEYEDIIINHIYWKNTYVDDIFVSIPILHITRKKGLTEKIDVIGKCVYCDNVGSVTRSLVYSKANVCKKCVNVDFHKKIKFTSKKAVINSLYGKMEVKDD